MWCVQHRGARGVWGCSRIGKKSPCSYWVSRILWVFFTEWASSEALGTKCIGTCVLSLPAGTCGTYLWGVAFYVVGLPEPCVRDVMGRTSPSIVPVIKDQPFQAVCEDIQPGGEAAQQYFMVPSMPWQTLNALAEKGKRLFYLATGSLFHTSLSWNPPPKKKLGFFHCPINSVLQKNMTNEKAKDRAEFWHLMNINEYKFSSPSCEWHWCGVEWHQHWQLCGLYWNSTGRAELTGPAKPPTPPGCSPWASPNTHSIHQNLQRQVGQSMPSIQTDF